MRVFVDLPIIVEIIDTIEEIEACFAIIDGAIGEGSATLERVDIRFYRSGERNRDE